MSDKRTHTCTRCGQEKDSDEFNANASKLGGLERYCAECGYMDKHQRNGTVATFLKKRFKGTGKDMMLRRKDVSRAQGSKRRSRKIYAGGTHSSSDIRRQGESQRWRCWWCGKYCKEKYHADHLVALAKGGHNDPSNIVIACPSCNLKKNAKTPDEFCGRLL